MGYYASVISSIGITLIGILSIYVVTGLTGMFSLGQASFMAVGAYVAGLMATKLGLPFIVCIIGGILVGAAVGFLVGLPTTRLRKDYVALVTLAFGEAIIAVLNNLAATGGAMGLSGIPKKTTPLLVVVSCIVIIYLIWNLKASRFGRQCLALKRDPLAAKSMGINVDRLKLTAFVIGAAITSFAGTLYAFNYTYLDPTAFTWDVSAEWIIVVIFGGMNSLSGTVVAGVVLGALPEILRSAAELRIIIYCIIVLIIINFRPQGLFGSYEFNISTIKQDIKRLFMKTKRRRR